MSITLNREREVRVAGILQEHHREYGYDSGMTSR